MFVLPHSVVVHRFVMAVAVVAEVVVAAVAVELVAAALQQHSSEFVAALDLEVVLALLGRSVAVDWNIV